MYVKPISDSLRLIDYITLFITFCVLVMLITIKTIPFTSGYIHIYTL